MDPNSDEERVLQLLAEARNRQILTALHDAGRSLSIDELAERLGSGGDSADSPPDPETEFERVLISLHHDRLPRLDDAGLLEYDRETNRIVVRDATASDTEWIDAEMCGQLLERFRANSVIGETDIGIVEGRENVVEQGRRLADEADEELFLMYESDDLLEPNCLDYARDALERGVDIYLGSQTADVRDLARNELPEATLWEPQLDLQNAPSAYPQVGRFVLADREKILLTILNDPDEDITTTETAVMGEGRENPLVVLVRELLGPRLDHLDYQSDEFRNQLPF